MNDAPHAEKPLPPPTATCDARPFTREDRQALFAVLALAIVLYGFLSARMACISRDGVFFVEFAKQLADAPVHWLGVHTKQPGYSFVLLGVHKIFGPLLGGDTPLGWQRCGQLVATLGGVASCGLIFVLARRLFDTTIAFMAGLLAVCWPAGGQLSADVLSDMPHLALYLAALLMAHRALQLQCARRMVACGVLAGAAYWMRLEALGVVGASAIAWMWPGQVRNRREKWIGIAALVLCFAAVVAPHSIATGRIVPSKRINDALFGSQDDPQAASFSQQALLTEQWHPENIYALEPSLVGRASPGSDDQHAFDRRVEPALQEHREQQLVFALLKEQWHPENTCAVEPSPVGRALPGSDDQHALEPCLVGRASPGRDNQHAFDHTSPVGRALPDSDDQHPFDHTSSVGRASPGKDDQHAFNHTSPVGRALPDSDDQHAFDRRVEPALQEHREQQPVFALLKEQWHPENTCAVEPSLVGRALPDSDDQHAFNRRVKPALQEHREQQPVFALLTEQWHEENTPSLKPQAPSLRPLHAEAIPWHKAPAKMVEAWAKSGRYIISTLFLLCLFLKSAHRADRTGRRLVLLAVALQIIAVQTRVGGWGEVSSRYMVIPLALSIPWAGAGLLAALTLVAAKLRARWPLLRPVDIRNVGLVVVMLPLVYYLMLPPGGERADYCRAGQWLYENAEPDDVVIAHERLNQVMFYAGRTYPHDDKWAACDETDRRRDLMRLIRGKNARWMVDIEQSRRARIDEAAHFAMLRSGEISDLTLVQTFGRAHIYKIVDK